jgi:exodeoxyribonuclease V alpha subunit
MLDHIFNELCFSENIFEKKEIEDFFKKCMENLSLTETDYLTIVDLLKTIPHYDFSLRMVLVCMFEGLNEGSLCVHLTEKSVTKKIKFLKSEKIESLLKEFIKNLNSGKYDILISKFPEDYKPIIFENGNIYFQKYYINEKNLNQEIEKLLGKKEFDFSLIDNNYENLKQIIDEKIIFQNIENSLNNEQKLAVILSLLKNFVIISGGPGTGKTSIISRLIRCFLQTGMNAGDIKLVAPTGRAAKRIMDSLISDVSKSNISNEEFEIIKTLESSTIHRLLRYNPRKDTFFHNEFNKLQAKVVIIDEVSMVDIILMTDLLQSIHEGTKLIFIGDKNQLPSVNAGAILAELIPKEAETSFSEECLEIVKKYFPEIKFENNIKSKLVDRIINLKETYRSKGKIYTISRKINEPDLSENEIYEITNSFKKMTINEVKNNWIYNFLEQEKNENCFFIEENNFSYKNITSLLTFYFNKYFLRNSEFVDSIKKLKTFDFNNKADEMFLEFVNNIFKTIENTKILTFVKESYCGSAFINDFFEKKFIENFNDISGIPVMITRNDYKENLFNGEIGFFITQNKWKKAVFKMSNSITVFDEGFLPQYESGFAITVHKSQGSEYNDILMILPENNQNRLLTKEIIYTGLTRAKNSAVIYGNIDIFKYSIKQKIERESGIDIWK